MAHFFGDACIASNIPSIGQGLGAASEFVAYQFSSQREVTVKKSVSKGVAQMFSHPTSNSFPLSTRKTNGNYYSMSSLRLNALKQINSELTFLSNKKKIKTENSDSIDEKGIAKKYCFHVEGDGLVKAFVTKVGNSYKVALEVSSLAPQYSAEEIYFLHWGLFRSDASDWFLLDGKNVPTGTQFISQGKKAMQTPFRVGLNGVLLLDLEFDLKHAPFFISFVLFLPSTSNRKETWIRSAFKSNFCIPVGLGKGRSEPLGFTRNRNSVNFAVYSKHAENVVLCLYGAQGIQPSLEINLDPSIHRTGDIWHIEMEDSKEYTHYGYRCKGPSSMEKGNRFNPACVLLDPYAKNLARFFPGQEALPSPAKILGSLSTHEIPFDWEEDVHPEHTLESLLIYRLNVAGFTGDKSSGLEKKYRGTFEGVAAKAEHLKSLGINAVILQPIFAFDKSKGSFYPLSFFCPMHFLGPSKDTISASLSLKNMVKQLHRLGIEVILDVVYSHTAENGDKEPEMASFRGIDNATYYILDSSGRVTGSDWGSENMFNCNHPVVQKMIMDSLRYWVTEYHVDGFCFENCSSLILGPHGQDLSRPPLVEAITFDPVLAKTKLIADHRSAVTGICKDCSFGACERNWSSYSLIHTKIRNRLKTTQLEKLVYCRANLRLLRKLKTLAGPMQDFVFPHWKRWCESNNVYRDDVRMFVRGDKGKLSSFATRLCGSADLFADGRGPCFSVNYISSPYGLSLVDLVSYSSADGLDAEYSWNCGEEGPTSNVLVLEARVKQVHNFLMCLFLSQGVPILNMGDEYGFSKRGSLLVEERRVFNWDALNMKFGVQMTQFITSIAAFRNRRGDILQQKEFMDPENFQWHGAKPGKLDWESIDSSFIAVSIKPPQSNEIKPTLGDLYVAFNPQQIDVSVELPEPTEGMIWFRIADTGLPYPENITIDGVKIASTETESCGTYEVKALSSILLEAQPVPMKASL